MKHNPEFLNLVNEAKKHIVETDIHSTKTTLEQNSDIVLVDVREDREWEKDHLPNAIHIGKGVIECFIEEKIPNKDTPMILYCGGGYRSALAAEALGKMGYTNVQSMNGGYRGWVEAGLPIEK